MKKAFNRYVYDGPVYIFGAMVCEHYMAETFATSVQKAKSNLEYRYKNLHGYTKNAMIKLDPEKIDMVYE